MSTSVEVEQLIDDEEWEDGVIRYIDAPVAHRKSSEKREGSASDVVMAECATQEEVPSKEPRPKLTRFSEEGDLLFTNEYIEEVVRKEKEGKKWEFISSQPGHWKQRRTTSLDDLDGDSGTMFPPEPGSMAIEPNLTWMDRQHIRKGRGRRRAQEWASRERDEDMKRRWLMKQRHRERNNKKGIKIIRISSASSSGYTESPCSTPPSPPGTPHNPLTEQYWDSESVGIPEYEHNDDNLVLRRRKRQEPKWRRRMRQEVEESTSSSPSEDESENEDDDEQQAENEQDEETHLEGIDDNDEGARR